MSAEIIFGLHLILGYVAWLLCFRTYLFPRLKSMEQVVHAGAAQSRVADHWSQQRKLKDTYTTGPRGLMDLMHKDLRLALELGHDLGLSLPGAALTQQLLQRVLEIED